MLDYRWSSYNSGRSDNSPPQHKTDAKERQERQTN